MNNNSTKKWSAQRIIHGTLLWSKAFVPILAILAATASAIRTIQAITEIYAASGTAPGFVTVAAVAFTLCVEAALFVLALAQESQRIKWRAARKKRHVTSLKSIAYSIQVRLGFKEPLSYDQMPDGDNGLGTLMWIAFLFAIASNIYLGLRPLTDAIGASSIQSFMSSILNANANLQMKFIVDLAAALFPPFVERAAGGLAARQAAEIATSQRNAEQPKRASSERAKEQPKQRSKLTAKQRVIEHLIEHPEDEQLPVRALAGKIGVSTGTVSGVQKQRSIEHSSNGNTKETIQ